MSVIRHHADLPSANVPGQTRPGWQALAAMTAKPHPSDTLRALLRPVVRPVLRPVVRPALRSARRLFSALLGRGAAREIAMLRERQEDLAMALSEVMADRAAGRAQGMRPQAGVRPRNLVWISPWRTRCGIAEYSRQFLEAFPGREQGWQVTVLHDQRQASPQIAPLPGVAARAGFALGEPGSAARLALAIVAEQADCVVIQHHAALIPWPVLADLLLHPAVAARRIVVVLHNTQEILGLAPRQREHLHLALHGADRVVAHTPRDLALLHAFGLNNAMRIAHGCAGGAGAGPARALPPQSSSPLLGSTGFLMPHKGARQLIRAASDLRFVWPALRLRLAMARYDAQRSDREFEACTALARKLGFEAHLEWYTGFAPQHRVMELLAPCDLLVLPYGKTSESSSAAARIAVASGVPTLVSELPIFDDLGDAVGRLHDEVPGGLAGQIEDWLHSTGRRARLQLQAEMWRRPHDWRVIGGQMLALLDTLVPEVALEHAKQSA
jgi:glycosyltransferase involved in cell wall biosynthesis